MIAWGVPRGAKRANQFRKVKSGRPASAAVTNPWVVPGTSSAGTKTICSASRKTPRPGASGSGAPDSSRRNGSSATLANGSTAVTGAASHTTVT